ncbi:hypothetical protein I552_0072 [Mycobacterium xenopi 3993]|nr:hypothetical protein I552_0072 [Mycobacterium xenopi 3993]
MGPTRKRDLTAAVIAAAVVGYLLVVLLYRWFPPITVWTGVSLLALATAEAAWGRYVRAKINDGEIGDGPGWLHPLAVARSVMIAKASAWVAPWCSAGGSGCWCTCCRGARRCGSPVRTPPRRGRGRLRTGSARRRAVAAALLQISERSHQKGRGHRKLTANRPA